MIHDPDGALFALTCWSVCVSAVDLRTRRLPNDLTGFGAVAVLLAATYDGRLGTAAAGGLLLAAIYALGFVVSGGGIGGGDVKLAVSLGGVAALHGSGAWLFAALAAPVATLVSSIVTRSTKVPHGPSMCAATLVAQASFGT